MTAKTNTNNRLWQARRRVGLEQKQVAFLLGHKNINQISRYERGEKTPGLKTALKLELILRVSVADLFPDHYQVCRSEIAGRRAQVNLPESYDASPKRPKNAHICTYANQLLQKKPTDDEISATKTHTINLVRELGDAIGRRQR